MNKTLTNFKTKRPLSHQIQKRRPETATNVKFISKSEPIEILPPEVVIKDIETNQTYEVVILVRNLTSISRRIRIFQPKTSKFRCDYDMQGAVAAGLAMKLLVTFETNVLNDYHDSITITSDEGFKAEVPLHAYMPQAQILFEPIINFGFVPLTKTKVETIMFKNEGAREGTIELKMEKLEELKIDREKFIIMPHQSIPVKIQYQYRSYFIIYD